MPTATRPPNVKVEKQATLAGESPTFLSDLYSLARAFPNLIFDVFSGYRTPQQSVAVGGFANDPHTRGIAADITVGGKPIGQVFTQSQLARYGLMSGNTPNFYKGKPDPSHLQLTTGLNSTPVLSAMPGTAPSGTLTGQGLLSFIVTEAKKLGLDPKAVYAVVTQEGGLSGKVGDSGTSYGPFQLHKGGALPAWVAARGPAFSQQWAQSASGVEYGLQQEAKVAKGETGLKAIQDIVTKFEHPANPQKEIVGAYTQYVGFSPNWTDTVSQGLTGAIESPLKWGEALVKFLGKLTDPAFWIRVLEMLAGGVLLLTGLYLLVRQVGLSTPSPPGPTRRVAETVA